MKSRPVFNIKTVGSLSEVVHHNAGAADLSRSAYEVDERGRRIQAEIDGDVFQYWYDANNRLVRYDLNGESYDFTYDAVGNRRSASGPGWSEVYQVDVLDRYTTAGGRELTYDASGNVVEIAEGGETITYDFDPVGRLTRVEGSGFDVTYEIRCLR